ncbi:MAG TPA: diguanylate cyclase [Nitrospiraceae bacterium]|nr:diguanylate cyclase [Nitrospiraceae bacterium]
MPDGDPKARGHAYEDTVRRLTGLHQLIVQVEHMAERVFPQASDYPYGPSLPPEVVQFQTRKTVVETERQIRQAIVELFGPNSAEAQTHQHLSLSTPAQVALTIGAFEDLLFQLEVEKLTMENSGEVNPALPAHLDPLTDLYGHRLFERLLTHELSRSQRFGYTCTLSLFALQRWPDIVSHDQSAADYMLVALTCACKASLRGYDQVCRIADNELAVMLPQSDGWEAELVCRRIITRFDQIGRQRASSVNVEVGLATFPFDAETSTALFNTAQSRRVCIIQ